MKYQLIYSSAAEEELATIWLEADDKRAVTETCRRIDQQLAFDPETMGESRDFDTRGFSLLSARSAIHGRCD